MEFFFAAKADGGHSDNWRYKTRHALSSKLPPTNQHPTTPVPHDFSHPQPIPIDFNWNSCERNDAKTEILHRPRLFRLCLSTCWTAAAVGFRNGWRFLQL